MFGERIQTNSMASKNPTGEKRKVRPAEKGKRKTQYDLSEAYTRKKISIINNRKSGVVLRPFRESGNVMRERDAAHSPEPHNGGIT